MMKKILVTVYTVCALLVIIGSLLWFVFTLQSDSTAGKAESLKNFKIFAQHTGEILSESAQAGNPARLQVQLEQLCRNYSKYVQAILIKDSAGIVFIWPKNTDIFSYNEQYIVEVKNLPLFFTAAQTHIPVKETGNTVTVHAALQMLPLETVFNRGQIVFVLLLLIVLMTVLVLVFSYIDMKSIAEKKPEFKAALRSSETDSINANTAQQSEYFSPAANNEVVAMPHTETYTETPPPIEEDSSAPLQTEGLSIRARVSNLHEQPAPEKNKPQPSTTASSVPLNVQLESLNRLHIYDDNDEQSKKTAPEYQENSYNAQPENSSADRQNNKNESTEKTASSNKVQADVSQMATAPQAASKQSFDAGNYGFFENHTQPLKASSQAQETTQHQSTTSFENTPLSNAARGDSRSLEQAMLIEELTNAITETAAAEEDLTLLLIHADDIPHNQHIIHLLRSTLDRIHKVFAFNKDILGVIVFYASFDQAMQIASNLYDEINELLDPSVKKSLGIGLTTRAGRLIPAPRMIEEAMAAIGKATQEGGDPIVAFRVNPDKYRRCLTRLG